MLEREGWNAYGISSVGETPERRNWIGCGVSSVRDIWPIAAVAKISTVGYIYTYDDVHYTAILSMAGNARSYSACAHLCGLRPGGGGALCRADRTGGSDQAKLLLARPGLRLLGTPIQTPKAWYPLSPPPRRLNEPRCYAEAARQPYLAVARAPVGIHASGGGRENRNEQLLGAILSQNGAE